MKFVDEAKAKVQAGNGGRGSTSFRREKFVPFGGPDGGDGGHGGSVYLRAAPGINTLVDFRVERNFKAQSGEGGSSQDCTGRSGEDLYVNVPIGTVVKDLETGEELGDLNVEGKTLLVARGGKGGWGNTRFKTSTNRAPRQFGPGLPGEKRELALELKVIADVGLLGLPNAGKSTLIRAVSAARPKVADYPFTTLIPNLGVVDVGQHRSFVMADIPGLIEGAAEGAGLGIRFLKHLQRTRVLLHLVDIAPVDPDADPVRDAKAIVGELKKFSPDLIDKPRWLVLNKRDLLPDDEAEQQAKKIIKGLRHKGPHFLISGATNLGTQELVDQIMQFLEEINRSEREAAAEVAADAEVAAAKRAVVKAETEAARAAARERLVQRKKAGVKIREAANIRAALAGETPTKAASRLSALAAAAHSGGGGGQVSAGAPVAAAGAVANDGGDSAGADGVKAGRRVGPASAAGKSARAAAAKPSGKTATAASRSKRRS